MCLGICVSSCQCFHVSVCVCVCARVYVGLHVCVCVSTRVCTCVWRGVCGCVVTHVRQATNCLSQQAPLTRRIGEWLIFWRCGFFIECVCVCVCVCVCKQEKEIPCKCQSQVKSVSLIRASALSCLMHINAGDCMSVCVYMQFIKKCSKAKLAHCQEGWKPAFSITFDTHRNYTNTIFPVLLLSLCSLSPESGKEIWTQIFCNALPTKSTTDPWFNFTEGGHFFQAPIRTAMKWLQAIRTQESILGSYCCRLTGLFSANWSQGLYSQHRFAQKRKALRDNWQKPSVALQISLHPFYPPFSPSSHLKSFPPLYLWHKHLFTIHLQENGNQRLVFPRFLSQTSCTRRRDICLLAHAVM